MMDDREYRDGFNTIVAVDTLPTISVPERFGVRMVTHKAVTLCIA